MPRSFLTKLTSAQDVFTFRDFILLPGRSEVEPGASVPGAGHMLMLEQNSDEIADIIIRWLDTI